MKEANLFLLPSRLCTQPKFFFISHLAEQEIGDNWAKEFPLVIGCRREYRSTSTCAPLITGIIVTGMIVTPLTLAAGSVLSQQNGKYVLRCSKAREV